MPEPKESSGLGGAPHLYLYQTGNRPDGFEFAIASSVAKGVTSGTLALFVERDDAHIAAAALCAAKGPEWEMHVLPSAATPLEDMVEHVKMYAVDHGGAWSVIIDAWHHRDIEDALLKAAAFTKADALAVFADVIDKAGSF